MDETEKLRTEIRELKYALARQTQATNRMANNAQNWKDLADQRAQQIGATLRRHDGCDRIIAALNHRLTNCTCGGAP